MSGAISIQCIAGRSADHHFLSPQAYGFCFPVLRAVLSSPQHSPLHDEALAVVALHCAPDADISRRESLALLYHVLGINPTYRHGARALLCTRTLTVTNAGLSTGRQLAC